METSNADCVPLSRTASKQPKACVIMRRQKPKSKQMPGRAPRAANLLLFSSRTPVHIVSSAILERTKVETLRSIHKTNALVSSAKPCDCRPHNNSNQSKDRSRSKALLLVKSQDRHNPWTTINNCHGSNTIRCLGNTCLSLLEIVLTVCLAVEDAFLR